MRCFISTDFPCPDPPMMMLVLPALDVEVDARAARVRAERLVDAADADLLALVALRRVAGRRRCAGGGRGCVHVCRARGCEMSVRK